jgi:hypothetical protein
VSIVTSIVCVQKALMTRSATCSPQVREQLMFKQYFSLRARTLTSHALAMFCLLISANGSAHHSYAMFDGSQVRTITGTVAQVEWVNPHVFLWVYVRNPESETGYDLYALENGSPNVLRERGWSKSFFEEGELVAIRYWPSIDGQNGGHFAVATRADGTVVYGAGGPGGSPDAGKAIAAPPAPEASGK